MFCVAAEFVWQDTGVWSRLQDQALCRRSDLQGGWVHWQEQWHTLPGLQAPSLQQVRWLVWSIHKEDIDPATCPHSFNPHLLTHPNALSTVCSTTSVTTLDGHYVFLIPSTSTLCTICSSQNCRICLRLSVVHLCSILFTSSHSLPPPPPSFSPVSHSSLPLPPLFPPPPLSPPLSPLLSLFPPSPSLSSPSLPLSSSLLSSPFPSLSLSPCLSPSPLLAPSPLYLSSLSPPLFLFLPSFLSLSLALSLSHSRTHSNIVMQSASPFSYPFSQLLFCSFLELSSCTTITHSL